jgi:hypothetical protein
MTTIEVCQIHLAIPQHQRSDERPMRRYMEIQPYCAEFEQLENRIPPGHLRGGNTTSVTTGWQTSIGARTCFVSAIAQL